MITTMLAQISAHRGRRQLACRKEPYWGTIVYGRAIGFLKKRPTECYWVARCRTPEGGYRFHRLGEANQGKRADGRSILTYAQARAAADLWFSELERSGVAAGAKPLGRKLTLDVILREGPYSVAHAMVDYVAWKKLAASPSYYETIISHGNTYILPLLGHLPAEEVTGLHFQDFVRASIEMVPSRGARRPVARTPIDRMSPETLRRRKKTINSVITILRDALQMAWDNGKIYNDRSFRTFRRFAHASAPRLMFLNRDECRRLLDASDSDLRDLILGALYTGCRSGELLNLRVSDIGREGYGVSVAPQKSRSRRFVFLPDEGMAFFLRLAKGRDANATLFLRKSGAEWGAQHRYYFRLAIASAYLPKSFTFHGLRHTYASQLIQAGAPLQAVADQLGHANTTTVSRTYAHFAPQIRESEIRQRFRGVDPAMKRRADRMRHELKALRAAIYGGDGAPYAEIADLKSRRLDRDHFGINRDQKTPDLRIRAPNIPASRGAEGKTTKRALARILTGRR